MAKLIFALNQSLDGYVDHMAFAPEPAVFLHFIDDVRSLAGMIYGRRMYEVMRYWDEDRPEWGEASSRLAVGLLLVIGLFGVTYAVVMAHARAFMSAQEIGRGVTFMNFVFMGGAGVMQWLSGRLVNALDGHGYGAQATFGWLFIFMGVMLAAALAIYIAAPAEPKATPAAA